MTKRTFLRITEYWKDAEMQAITNRKYLEKEYIEEHAPYPIGSELRIAHIGKERKVRIQSYNVDDNGGLTPVFETL